ncbi:hypothetical protein [Mesorhizobium australicum]
MTMPTFAATLSYIPHMKPIMTMAMAAPITMAIHTRVWLKKT